MPPLLLAMPRGDVGVYGGCSSRHNLCLLQDNPFGYRPGTLQ
jgi:hypothetical protein